jgi:stearoyl-CoA desaturase (Delta-9 desaturase)
MPEQPNRTPHARVRPPRPPSPGLPALSPRHIVFVTPLILLHLACGLVAFVGVSKPAVAVFFCASSVQIFGITVGYHRLLAHRAFKTSRAFQFVLALCGVLAGQNGPLWWVGHHRHHHRYADRDRDTHSPRRGLFWSHMGWLLSPACVPGRRELVPDLARFPELAWLDSYSYLANFAHATLLYLAGEGWRAIDPSAAVSGWQFVVWGVVLSTVWSYHGIWSANSVCHRFGSRRYPTRDDSRNNLVVALWIFGDGWHHNHHRYPRSARHGLRWWEIDVNYAVLVLLSRIGLVWGLRLPPQPARVAARSPAAASPP